MKNIIRLSVNIAFVILLITNALAQSSTRFKKKIIKLRQLDDSVRVNFQSDSVKLSFSREEVLNYVVKDLKNSKNQIREFEGKKILLDSLKKGGISVSMLPTFAAQHLKNELQSAMFVIAPALLKRGHVEIEKNKERVKNITYTFIHGHYGSEHEVFYIKNQRFYYYIVMLGE